VKLVVDASVSVKWFLADQTNEADVDKALMILNRLITGEDDLFQPPHWAAEVLAVVTRRKPDLARDAVEALFELTSDLDGDFDFAGREAYVKAAALSTKLNHHLFDTLYHARAIQENALLVTADEKYFQIARAEGSICLLRNFDATETMT
jgi:predicted nucleic acid-binding protein